MPAPNPNRRTLVRLAIVLVILAAAGFVAQNRFRPTAPVTTVQRGTAVDIVTGSVVVHAEKDLQEIKSEFGGRVAWIDPRQLGHPFKEGEPIIRLDTTDLERQKKQARDDFEAQQERLKLQKSSDATLQVAKEALANAELQYRRHAISEQEWRNAQRNYQHVETNLALADFDTKQARIKFENDQDAMQRQIDRMTIRAPMDGVVQGINVARGALIGGSTTVATFYSNQRAVIAKVGEEEVSKVKIGQSAKVRLLNLGNETFDAKVTTILPFAEPDTQRYSVYLEVQAELSKLKPNSTGEATITVGERANQPLVPRRALLNDSFVLVVNDGVVEKRKVSIGYKALNLAEVTANLKEGELVIVENLDQFRDGQRVRPVAAQ